MTCLIKDVRKPENLKNYEISYISSNYEITSNK